QAKERPPVCGAYRGYRICGMGPPSSGATTVYAILKQLERFDLGALGPNDPKAWHLIGESMRLAYADRDAYLADPDFIRVPVANRVEGGKRPRSSMSPTIVYGPDGRVRLAVGAAGGATIIAQVAKAIIGVIDWKLSAQEAIALPVLYAPGDTLYVERGTAMEA